MWIAEGSAYTEEVHTTYNLGELMPEEKGDDVTRLQANLKNITDRQFEQVKSLKALEAKVTKGSITNWSLIASMIGASLTGISMIGWLTVEPLKEEILRLRAFKMKSIKALVTLGQANAITKERTRALERIVFKEGKDQ